MQAESYAKFENFHLQPIRDPAVKQMPPKLGKMKNAINEKAKRMLGWASLSIFFLEECRFDVRRVIC